MHINSKLLFIFSVILFFSKNFTYSQNFTISGIVKESNSQETLAGVAIFQPKIKKGTNSNSYGFFSITIPKVDSTTITFSLLGYKSKTLKYNLKKDLIVEIYLDVENYFLNEVVVNASEPEKKSNSYKISSISIPIIQLKNVPSLMGEKDIIKAIQLLPGVQNGTEGSNGLFVRGGGADQNLILMDEAKVYNISHLFGFFSIFNGDALKSLEFIKGGFPARYGGRISSVLDVQMKDGNKTEFHGEVGVGLITSRLTLETPIIKNKASLIISARRTYPDILFSTIKNPEGSKLKSNFYDVNSKLNFDLNGKNRFFLSTYNGKDNFFQRVNKKGEEFRNLGFSWGNLTSTFRWNHIFTQKIFSNLSVISSKFNYSAENSFGTSSQTFASKLDEIGLKYDLEYLPNIKNDIRIGLNFSKINFTPNFFISKDNGSRTNIKEVEKLGALDGAFYIEDIIKPISNLALNLGLRSSFFFINEKNFSFLEPRCSFNYSFKEYWSFKFGYSQMNQPLQLITNSGLGLSIDVWIPSTEKIPPQHSEQFNIGLVHDFSKALSFELEYYSKKMSNIIAIKEGASVFSTVSLFRDRDFKKKLLWEDITTQGKGESKGLELFIHKNYGKLTGWASYTLAKTTNTFKSLNNGQPFLPIYDRRHQLALVGIYQNLSKLKFTGNLVIGSGTPVTLPVSTYENFEIDPFTKVQKADYYNVVDYGVQRNEFKTPLYHRLDLSVQLIKKKAKQSIRTWEFGFYNILGHRNIFAYEVDINGKFDEKGNFIRTKNINEMSLLLFIPSVSYYYKF